MVQIPLHTSTCLRLCQVVVPSGFGPSRGSRWAHGRAVCAYSGRSTRRVHFIKHTSAESLGTKLSVFLQSTHPPTYIRVQTPSPCALLVGSIGRRLHWLQRRKSRPRTVPGGIYKCGTPKTAGSTETAAAGGLGHGAPRSPRRPFPWNRPRSRC